MSETNTEASETWRRFRAEAESCGAHLKSELTESWENLHDLLVAQNEAFQAAAEIELPGMPLECLDAIFRTHASGFLLTPIEKYRRERPQQRAKRAFDEWDSAMEGIIRAMPESISISGPEWIEVTGVPGAGTLSRAILRWRRDKKRVAFRQNLLYGFRIYRVRRRKTEGRLLYALADSALELVSPWHALLQVWLPRLASEPKHPQDLERQKVRLQTRLARHERDVARAFEEVQAWVSHSSEAIGSYAAPGRKVQRAGSQMATPGDAYFRDSQFWVRQARAVDSEVELSRRLAAGEQELMAAARSLLGAIEKEHNELLDELSSVMQWLENWRPSEPSSFPPAQADIVSAPSRLSSWDQSLQRALEQVPESVEVASRLAVRPGQWPSWKAQTPRRVFRVALERQTNGVIRDGLEQLESQHQGIVREIERAREVVTFASETARAADSGELQIEREGVENARSLLAFHRDQTQKIPPEVARSLAMGLAAASLRAHTALEEGQFGIVRQGVRYGLPAALRAVWRLAVDRLRDGAKAGARVLADLYREALIRVGWAPAPTARIQHVSRRGYLSHSLGLGEFHPEGLPMIYQRLFRLAPVDDPRFLIGREHELAALAEARTLWEQEREAGVLLVGERGSGKTSLLNCALQSTLSGLEVIRGEFSNRLFRQDQMEDFLASLLGTERDNLESDLTSKRRVIVLEEIERTFLRRVNHYEALRSLLNLIARTSKQTLWIVSTNYFSFRLLNASLRLDPHFSHRINAMAVDRNYLREAILMRHNLSGLRLLFAPPPEGRRYTERLKRAAGVEPDLESEFFDAIYAESGGVFRTAFALWQRHIDRAEGGALYMKYPTPPDYDTIMKSLNDSDLFTLAAILQHGSLTPHEHSLIFQIDTPTSNAWLNNLLARELIQPDPGRYGLRVIPEAGEIVRRTLFRRNVG